MKFHKLSEVIFKVPLIIIMLVSAPAFADKEAPPSSEAVFSDNGKYVYIRWLNSDTGPINTNFDNKFSTMEKNINRTKFPKSGLYEFTSNRLLWAISEEELNNYNHHFAAHVSNDGEHIVIKGPWASNSDQLAYAFFNKEKLLKKYAIKDICNDKKSYVFSVSHFMWKRDEKFDPQKNILKFEACGKKMEISAIDGNVISKK